MITPRDDPMRYPFRSHVFIAISPDNSYDRKNAVLVDACAGPVCGDLTYSEYLKEHALQDGDPLLLEGVTPMASHCAGVNGSDGAGVSKTLKQWLHEHYGGIPESITTALSKAREGFETDSAVSNGLSAQAAIDAVLDPIIANKDKESDNHEVVLINQHKAEIAPIFDQSNGSTITERKLAAIRHEVKPEENKSPTFVSFQLQVFPRGLEDAIKALEARLKLFTVPLDWEGRGKINVKKNPSDKWHINDPRIEVFGNNHLSLFVYKNVLMQISGNAVMYYIPRWTKAMVEYLNAVEK